MKETKVSIAFQNEPSLQESFDLNDLQDGLSDSQIMSERVIKPSPSGVKDGGITLALAIAGLALSAVGTFVSAIALWGSKRNYSISFKCGDTSFSANNLSAKEAATIAQALKDKAVAADIQVLVSRR